MRQWTSCAFDLIIWVQFLGGSLPGFWQEQTATASNSGLLVFLFSCREVNFISVHSILANESKTTRSLGEKHIFWRLKRAIQRSADDKTIHDLKKKKTSELKGRNESYKENITEKTHGQPLKYEQKKSVKFSRILFFPGFLVLVHFRGIMFTSRKFTQSGNKAPLQINFFSSNFEAFHQPYVKSTTRKLYKPIIGGFFFLRLFFLQLGVIHRTLNAEQQRLIINSCLRVHLQETLYCEILNLTQH